MHSESGTTKKKAWKLRHFTHVGVFSMEHLYFITQTQERTKIKEIKNQLNALQLLFQKPMHHTEMATYDET